METKQITIDSSLASTRLDKAISKGLDFSRKRVKDLLDQKKILVNQKSEKASYILKEGDQVEIEIPELESLEIQAEDLPLDIIYEDQDV